LKIFFLLFIVVSGENIIISGSSFSPSKGSVFVGSVEAAVTSWSDSQIVISVHDVLPGIQQLRIEAPNGYAVKAYETYIICLF
jgi:hypothetical protein